MSSAGHLWENEYPKPYKTLSFVTTAQKKDSNFCLVPLNTQCLHATSYWNNPLRPYPRWTASPCTASSNCPRRTPIEETSAKESLSSTSRFTSPAKDSLFRAKKNSKIWKRSGSSKKPCHIAQPSWLFRHD